MGPRIETARCLLRLPELDDAPAISRYCGEYDVAKNTARIPHPYPSLGAEMWVLITRAAWTPQGNQSLTVEHEGAVIGGGGVFRRTPNADWEIGYWIGRPHARRGYMTEAVHGACSFCFDQLSLHRVEAACLPRNEPSQGVLRKAGFREEGLAKKYLKIDGRWQDHVLFALLREDFYPSFADELKHF